MRYFFRISVIVTLFSTVAVGQPPNDLQIITSWPKGQTEGTEQVTSILATFNKPMVPLQKLPEGEGTGPLTLTPPLRGKYRWLGSSTVSFTPSAPFKIATQYSVTIKAGTKALDGSSLPRDVQWTFSTPRPKLVKTMPGHGSVAVDVKTPIFLQFSLPVHASKARGFIAITEGTRSGPIVKVVVSSPRMEDLRSARFYGSDSTFFLMLKPDIELKKDQNYVVVVKKGLPAAEGTLGTETESSFSFRTYGKFAFIEVTQPTDRKPNLPLTFRFNTPVAVQELAKHLKFEPSVEAAGSMDQWAWSSPEPTLHFRFSAQTKYTITISKGLQDIYGQRLGKDVHFAINTVSYDPAVSMTTGHGIVEAYGVRAYPVTVMNMEAVRVQMMRLGPESIVPILRSDTIYARHLELMGRFQIDKAWNPRAKRDLQTTAALPLDEALGAGKKGALLLQVSRPSDAFDSHYDGFLRADVQVTELGLTSKFSPDGILIWVTRLKDTKPVAGANVQIRDDSNRVIWEGITNGDGIVEAPGWREFPDIPREEWSSPRLWVIVTHGDDIAYTASTWNEGIEPYRFNVMTDWNPEQDPWQGMVFTERGIYRPGEEVEFKGIFRSRRKADWQIPSGEILLRVYDPQSDEGYRDSMRVNEFGSVAGTFKIPKDARLGYYTVEASIRKPQRELREGEYPYKVLTAASFRVEAYRVSEFEVEVRPNKESLVVGDEIQATISAMYLFGGALRNQPVRWRMRVDPTYFAPPNWDDYWFGRSFWSYEETAGPQSRLLHSSDTSLAADGSLGVSYKTEVGTVLTTGNLVVEGDVTSPSRQVISGRASVVIHQGEYYIGVSPSSTFIKTKTPLTCRIVSVLPGGEMVSGQNITFRVLKRQWHSVRRASIQGGFEWESQPVDSVLFKREVTTGSSPVAVSYTPDASGFYLVQAEGKDSRGNVIRTDAYFYASGDDYVAWERTNDDRIELVADKQTYKPGQTARIIVKNPYEEATALVSVEREGILRHWRATLKGSAPEISIPLDGKSLPNVFVSVVLLQGRMTTRPELDQTTDVGRPSFKIGYVNLQVDPGTRRLSLKTNPDKENYRPGDSVTVTLNVRDAAGAPARAEVAISVADKGTLNLIGYRLPDPFDAFYGQRPLSVVTTESRSQIVQARSFGEKGEDEGGGGGADLAGIETRGNFKSTAYWSAFLRTDSAGVVVVRFKLPDNLTTFMIMAVAQTKAAEFGYGENSFTVSKPLLLQASVPRFARLGDSFEAGVVVHNYTKQKGKVAIRTSVDGLLMKGRETVELDLDAGESKEVLTPFAVNRTGRGTFSFQARMGDHTDGVTVTIPLEIPRRKETVAEYRAVTAKADLQVIVPQNIHEGLGALDVTASSTALSGLESGVEYLFTYPYGCIEQKSSSVLPLIVGREMVEVFGLQALKGRNLNQVVVSTLNELRRYQVYNGGFAYWPGDYRDSPYSSAYAMYVLATAKNNGYDVDSRILSKGADFIREVLRWEGGSPVYPYTEHTWAATKTLILYTLAALGTPEPAYYEGLFKNLNSLPLFARANLLRAIAISTKNRQMLKGISQNLLNAVKVNPTTAHFEEPKVQGLEWCWSSNVRTTGIILHALIEADAFPKESDLPAKILRWLMTQQRGGRWSNTQENVHVVQALAAYYRKYERETPQFKAEIKLAAEKLLEKSYEGRSLQIDRSMRSLDKLSRGVSLPLTVMKDGTGTLYAGFRMGYFPKEPAKAAEEGMAITKSVELLNSQQGTEKQTFTAGSLIKITIRVMSPQGRNFVVVEDPLPAGFEAVNTSLITESSELGRILSSMDGRQEFRWWGSFNHKEFRDDKVMLFADQLDAGVHTFTYLARARTPGKFTLPASHVEMMYEPEVFGRTSDGKIEVR